MQQAVEQEHSSGEGRIPFSVFQALFSRIFANAVDGICLTSTDGRIHAANPAACRIFGRTEEEICRLGRDALLDQSDPRLRAAVEERLRVGRSQSVLTVIRPDGTLLPIEVTSAVLTEPGPHSPAVVFFRDVSQRARAEEALASERALLERIVGSLEDGVIVLDLRTRRVVRANAALERILGWSVDELSGRDTSVLYPTREEWERAGRDAQTAYAARGHYAGELTLTRRDGTPVPVRVYSRPVADDEGSVSLVVSVLHDLAEERRAEAERARMQTVLFQAQKLESLGVLAGGLAHDMNNLLAAMLGNASLASSELPEDDPAHAAIDDITASARQAAELVRQLLVYSGRSTGTPERMDLAAGVRETTQLLRASIPKKVALRIDLPPAPLPVQGNPAQLRQVVVNLVLNAGEALGDCAGNVAVTAGVETCEEGHRTLRLAEPPLPPGRYAWLEVSDDGPGMPAEVAQRALDPFFSTKGLGRGLGLPAVLGIVRTHRGALELESGAGRGTRVRVWIPAAPEEPAAAGRAKVGPGTGARALVVDDEPLVRRAARRLLESAGYAVAEAADGAEAVELFREHAEEFDVVLLDLCMPRMSGDETFAALRGIRPDLPVVLSSGYADAERFEKLLEAPRVRFAPKPYDRKELLEALATARS